MGSSDDPLAATLDALDRDGRLERLPLGGLDAGAVARLVPGAGAHVAQTLYERTGGNPFFLRELGRLLAERGMPAGDGAELPALVPDRVREVVGRRLAPLEPATRDVLAIAGVVARPFTIAGVARVGRMDREAVALALEPALAGRIVEPRADAPGRYGFAHAIVRDAVYDDLAPAVRGKLHAAVAALLEESRAAGGDATAAEAARHALAAARCGADPAPAWPLSLEAAREAAAVQAHTEAAAHYAGALEAVELGAEATPAQRLEASLSLAGALYAAGDIETARRRFRTVASAARRLGAADVQARAAVGFSEVQAYGEIDDEAIALLQEALDALPPDDSVLRARALALLGQRLDPVTDIGRSEALVDEGVAMARRVGDLDALVRVLSAAALVDWRPERAASRAAAIEEVLALTVRSTDPAALFWARTLRLRDALEAGDVAAAGEELGRLERLAAESRRSYYRWCLLVLQAAVALFAGRLEEGERLAEQAVALNRRHGDDADQEHTVQRLALALERRDPQTIPLAALRDYAARYPRLPVWQAMLARAEHACGHGEAARAAVAALARDGFAELLRTPDRLCGLVLLAEPVAAHGDAGQAGRLAEALAPHLRANAIMDAAWAAFGPGRPRRGRPRGRGGPPRRRRGPLRGRRSARRGLGRPGVGARRARRLGRVRCAGRPARAPRGARSRAGAAARRGSDHHAVGLHDRRGEVVLGGRDVAAAPPGVAPGAADDEPVLGVADERGRVQVGRGGPVEGVEHGLAVAERLVDEERDEDRSLLRDPGAPVGEPVRGPVGVGVQAVVGDDPVARRDVVEVLDAAGVQRAGERQVLLEGDAVPAGDVERALDVDQSLLEEGRRAPVRRAVGLRQLRRGPPSPPSTGSAARAGPPRRAGPCGRAGARARSRPAPSPRTSRSCPGRRPCTRAPGG